MENENVKHVYNGNLIEVTEDGNSSDKTFIINTCPKCGERFPNYSKFCPKCGSELNINIEKEKIHASLMSFCHQCGVHISAGASFCPSCGCKIDTNNQIPQKRIKTVVIILAGIVIILLAVIAGIVVNRIIYVPDESTARETAQSPNPTVTTNPVQSINERLNEVKALYDSGDYKGAQKKLYSINEEDMNADQRNNYNTFEINIESKLNAENNTSSPVKHAGNVNNYSAYDNSLSTAYISGAESGSVYFWTASSGDTYSTILTNGTVIYTTGHSSGERTLVKWNGTYGWITTKYISSSYKRSGHYISGASTGSVYVWDSAYGDTYYTTIPNGTAITPTGYYVNGRTEIFWGDGYAWITSSYVR